MIYLSLLLFLLAFLLFVVYVINGFDYIVPSFFMIGSFMLSALISLVAADRWQSIRFNTMITILLGITAFSIGDFIGSKLNFHIRIQKIKIALPFFKNKKTESLNASIDISKYLILFVCLFMLVIDFFYFKYIYALSVAAGNTQGYSQMFEYARRAVVNSRYNAPPMAMWLQHGNIITECLGYIFLYVFIYNIIIAKKVNYLYLFPCVLYLANLMTSTARIDVINFVCAIIIFYSVLSLKKNKKNLQLKPKIIAYAVIAIVAILISFRLLGYLTGKSSSRELWTDISTYGGSSIPALDAYLNSPKIPNEFFGQETLNRLYAVLRGLHLTNVKSYETTLPFIVFPDGSSTNIYTGFRRYIQDYGYIGMSFILLLMGLLYGAINKAVKKSKNIGVGVIIYAYFFYPVVMTFVDERFLISFTSLSMIYHIIYFLIIYRLIVGKSKNVNLIRILSHMEKK